eukprot:2447295-Rhodomonas_salina.3
MRREVSFICDAEIGAMELSKVCGWVRQEGRTAQVGSADERSQEGQLGPRTRDVPAIERMRASAQLFTVSDTPTWARARHKSWELSS